MILGKYRLRSRMGRRPISVYYAICSSEPVPGDSDPLPETPDLRALDRYRPLIDDWAAFRDAMGSPLPGCLWTNHARVAAQDLQQILRDDGVSLQPLPWYADAFRIATDLSVGNRWWYRAGLCHSQEEASLLPVYLLDPQPGERILDLCAAPGGKAAQIALAVGEQGTVVANDARAARARSLRANMERLGLMNLCTTRYDGSNYPQAAGRFDRVLVDAPCSCEGTLRKFVGSTRDAPPANPARYARLQTALLRRAVALCRPGGRIVYSTCTFAPEENEQVVDTVLKESAGLLQPLQLPSPGFNTANGITSWQGRRFDPRLEHTIRVWPQHNDSGGFFVAILEKAPAASGDTSDAGALDSIEAPELEPILGDRFGISAQRLASWCAYRRTGRGLHLATRSLRPPPHPAPEAMGLALVRTKAHPPKLSTAGAMLLGTSASRNLIEMTQPQLAAYLARSDFPVTAPQIERCAGSGYVIARHQGFGIGIAELDRERLRVRSLFPKRWQVDRLCALDPPG